MPIIENLKEQRNTAGMTQEQLAHAAGTSTRTIQRIEKGHGAILTVVRAVTKALAKKGGK